MGVAITVPAEVLTSRVTPTGILTLVAVAAVALVGCRVLWRVGVRNYSGASA